MLPRLLTLTFLTFALAAPTPPAIWELDPFIQRLVDMDPSFYDRYIVSGKIDGIAGLPMPGNSTVHYPQVATTRAEYESYQALTKRKIQPPTRRQVSQMPANPATTAAVAAQALWNRDTGTSYKDVKQTKLGDCWLDSVLTAMAFVNPWWIPSLFTLPVPNDPNTESAQVTLLLQPTTTLDVTLAGIRASPYAGKFSVSGSNWWPAAIEYALNAYWTPIGWTDLLTAGGMPAWALNWFTTAPQTTVYAGSYEGNFEANGDRIVANMAYAPQSPVCIATNGQATKLVANHAYAVLHADPAQPGIASKSVILLNPWGTVEQYMLKDIVKDILAVTWLTNHDNGPSR